MVGIRPALAAGFSLPGATKHPFGVGWVADDASERGSPVIVHL